MANHSVFCISSCIFPNSVVDFLSGSSFLIFSFLNYVIILIFEFTTLFFPHLLWITYCLSSFNFFFLLLFLSLFSFLFLSFFFFGYCKSLSMFRGFETKIVVYVCGSFSLPLSLEVLMYCNFCDRLIQILFTSFCNVTLISVIC